MTALKLVIGTPLSLMISGKNPSQMYPLARTTLGGFRSVEIQARQIKLIARQFSGFFQFRDSVFFGHGAWSIVRGIPLRPAIEVAGSKKGR